MKIQRFFLMALSFIALSCSSPVEQVSTPVNESRTVSDRTVTVPDSAVNGAAVNLPSRVNDGVILHAYRWPFNSIKASLQAIADAGYNAVQVSPVQGTKTDETWPSWYLMYQPTSLHVGNAQLGDYNAFASLCNEAEKYGIKIIVDAVLNHVADNGQPGQWHDRLDPILKRSDLFHNLGTCGNYKNRYDMTQKNLGNGPDFYTQKEEVQNLQLAFLNECIDAGADGFRFDAAKHIETDIGVDAWQTWAGNYWTKILGSGLHNKDNLYIYGEVLADENDNMSSYYKLMNVTAHGYGGTVRSAIGNKNLAGLAFLPSSIPSDRALVYLENHDNYEHNESRYLSQSDRKYGYAIMIPRAKMVTLFLDRNEDDQWKDADIAALNKFRNAMSGTEEYLRNPRNETLIIERGTKGAVIVNMGGDFQLDTPTALAADTYESTSGWKSTLTSNGSRLTGFVPAGAILVLYKNGPVEKDVTVHYQPGSDTGASLVKGGTSFPMASEGVFNNQTWYVATVKMKSGDAFNLSGDNSARTWDGGDQDIYFLKGDSKTYADRPGSPTNDLVIHFKEWEYAKTYTLHAWGGLTGDYDLGYEGFFSGAHWWKLTIKNAPKDFWFTFKNSNGRWEGTPGQFDRHYTNQGMEIFVKAKDKNINLTR